MAEGKTDRTEIWKAVKWTMILLVMLIVAFGAYKAYKIATAPARVVESASESMKSSADSVLNRLDIPLKNQRRFQRTAEAAFAALHALPETAPDGVKDRGFRMANLRGSEDRICATEYDFGNGPVPAFLAADNKTYNAAKAVGASSDRLIRIVITSPEETLGLNAEYDAETERWSLTWRTSTVSIPYGPDWAEEPMTEILRQVPRGCAAL